MRVGISHQTSVTLPNFVKGALAGEFFWPETRAGTRAVKLQIASISCWKCGKPIRAIRGYVINNYFAPLAEVSDRHGLAKFISALRQRMPEVTPVSLRYSGTLQTKYLAAACPFCSALLGNWFMTADFLPRSRRAVIQIVPVPTLLMDGRSVATFSTTCRFRSESVRQNSAICRQENGCGDLSHEGLTHRAFKDPHTAR